MPLTTSSAGAIIYSMLLTKSAVTGLYEAHPGALRNKFNTQQSTWIEMKDGGSAAVALEDCGGAASLIGGVGWWFKIVAAALGGGGGRRTCHNGNGINIVEAKGLLLQHQCQHWQEQQERMCLMQGMYVGCDGNRIGLLQRWWQWWQC
jgi:hypothetical protein